MPRHPSPDAPAPRRRARGEPQGVVPARHETVAHTAELALRLTADTPGELCAEACRALGLLLIGEAGTVAPAEPDVERTILVDGVDAEALLVNLLNEMIYLAETERWAPRHVRTVSWQPDRLVMQVVGAGLRTAPSRIKSATHHGLALRAIPQGWEAVVVFDV